MSDYVFENLNAEEQEAMYKRALYQLEQQLFEAQINAFVVPEPDQPDSNGESINQRMKRLVASIQRLKDSHSELIG